MPESTLKWQSFNQKKPYLIASVFSLVAVVAAIGLLFDKLASAKTEALQALHTEVEPLKQRSDQFAKARENLQKTQKDVDQMVTWMGERYYWGDVLTELRGIMIKVQSSMKGKFRTDTGIWIEQFQSAAPRAETTDVAGGAEQAAPERSRSEIAAAADEAFRKRYGLMRRPTAAAPTESASEQVSVDATGTPARRKKAGPGEVASVTITFRAVSLNSVSPEANKEIVYSMLNEIKASPLFDPDWTDPDGKGIGGEEPPGTFTFGVTVGLKHPFKL